MKKKNIQRVSAFGIVIYSMIVIVVIPALFPLKKLK